MEQYRTPIALDQVRITDELYGPMLRLVAERVLPYQWEALNDRVPGTEKSHCLDNFRVAAGDLPGRHQGAIFQDTDLYKWLEAVAYCIANGTGKHLLPLAQEAAVLIARAQEPDGYLNTYITIECPEKRWSNLAEGHELYGAGHLIEAAVAYYRATGEKLLLDTAQRFADLIDRTFGAEDGKCHGYPGHQEIELALVKLYRATGEKRYLHLADYFIRQRGQKPNYLLAEMAGRKGRNVFPEFCEYDDKYAQTHLPPLEQTTAEGHAVRAVYMYSAMADLALELGDPEMARAAETLYNNIVQRRMYITGGIGSGFYSADGSSVTINEEAATEAIQAIADLYLVHHVAPLSTGLTDDGVQRSLIAGTCAMTTNGAWNIGTCLEEARNSGLNYGIAVLPYMKEKVTICTGGPNVVFSQTEHPEEAMEFIKWYSSEENSWDGLIAKGIWMPITDQYYTNEEMTKKWLENPSYPAYEESKPVLCDYVRDYAVPTSWYYVNNTTDFNALLGSILGNVWTGKTTAAEAIAENYDALVAAYEGFGA